MRIGVVGDTHDRMPNVAKIAALFRSAGVSRIVHTGDITKPQVLEALAEVGVPMLAVLGNNDRADRKDLEVAAGRLDVELVDPPHGIVWAGRRILVVHDPDEAPTTLPAALDLLLHGHTHRFRDEILGTTRVFNPGECAGFLAGANAVGVIDLVSLEAERLFF